MRVHQCAVFMKEKNVTSGVSDSVWHLLRQYDISLILSINFHSRFDEEQLPSFTQSPTPWHTC